jgi:lipopolysaccharide/colanic/teichoic acid biosynthesis glycosyltransferase
MPPAEMGIARQGILPRFVEENMSQGARGSGTIAFNNIAYTATQAGGVVRPYAAVKAGVEWVIGLMLFLLTLPLVAALALLVKVTSPGPALYLQTRLGRHGKPYRICKLRTMAHNCEAATGPVWASKDDVRITAVGRFLRMTHLDELPQLWNVLKGEMGLIGPRPERPEIVSRIERDVPRYRERLQLRPGVSGLAQMRVPADTDLESVRLKLAHDLYYIRHLSLLMDLRIAVCTGFYFLGTAAEAICDASVGGYGRDVKRSVRAPHPTAQFSDEESDEPECEMMSRANCA